MPTETQRTLQLEQLIRKRTLVPLCFENVPTLVQLHNTQRYSQTCCLDPFLSLIGCDSTLPRCCATPRINHTCACGCSLRVRALSHTHRVKLPQKRRWLLRKKNQVCALLRTRMQHKHNRPPAHERAHTPPQPPQPPPPQTTTTTTISATTTHPHQRYNEQHPHTHTHTHTTATRTHTNTNTHTTIEVKTLTEEEVGAIEASEEFLSFFTSKVHIDRHTRAHVNMHTRAHTHTTVCLSVHAHMPTYTHTRARAFTHTHYGHALVYTLRMHIQRAPRHMHTHAPKSHSAHGTHTHTHTHTPQKYTRALHTGTNFATCPRASGHCRRSCRLF